MGLRAPRTLATLVASDADTMEAFNLKLELSGTHCLKAGRQYEVTIQITEIPEKPVMVLNV